jgi:NAD(P)H dehydrogenase (quinone)
MHRLNRCGQESKMANVAIVYQSKFGHTKTVAEAVGRGVERVENTTLHLMDVEHDMDVANNVIDWETLDQATAIIFGSATYMGSVSSGLKRFFEEVFFQGRWTEQVWKDKLAGGFTDSGSRSGDKVNTIFDIVTFAGQMAMLWVPVGDPPGNNWSGGSEGDINRLGSSVGLLTQSNGDQTSSNADQEQALAPPEADRQTAERYGERVARLAGHFAWEQRHETKRLSAAH